VSGKLLLHERFEYATVAEGDHGPVIGARQNRRVAEAFGALVHQDRVQLAQQGPIARNPFGDLNASCLVARGEQKEIDAVDAAVRIVHVRAKPWCGDR